MAVPAPERSARLATLLSRVALGDQTAFAQFYEATSAHLYGVALRILRDGPAAEEILRRVGEPAAAGELRLDRDGAWKANLARTVVKGAAIWPRLESREPAKGQS